MGYAEKDVTEAITRAGGNFGSALMSLQMKMLSNT